MSLRLRLTLAYLMLLAPVLVMFSVVVYVIASHRIYGAVDDGLANRMTSIGPLLPNDHALGPADIQTALPLLDQASTTGFSFTILDVNGAHLYESPEAGHDIPASNLKPGDLQLSPRNAPGRDTRYSYQALTAPDGSTLGFIGAAVSLEPTDDALHELIGVFVVGGILMILITGIPTYVIAGRALQPIDDLSMLARDIEETADFRRRLSDKGLRGEVAELIRTFNAMIARVETMLDTQRRFFADSSHEMRRPLTIFRTNLDVIQNARLPEDERDACLDEMRIEATAMSDLCPTYCSSPAAPPNQFAEILLTFRSCAPPRSGPLPGTTQITSIRRILSRVFLSKEKVKASPTCSRTSSKMPHKMRLPAQTSVSLFDEKRTRPSFG